MLFDTKKRYFWAFHVFALIAIVPLVLTLKFDLISIFGVIAFATLFVSSFVDGKRRLGRVRPFDTESVRALAFVSDFEDRGLGWFWEVGREGELTYISKSISLTLGKTQSELLGLKFASILSDDKEKDGGQQWMTLGFHLSSRTPFTDLPFKSSIGENRYWSISGSPVYDQLGNYQGFRGNGLDLSQKNESERVLNQLAKCDPLTGLANRLEINRTLEKILIDQNGEHTKCSLFLLDLDKFKPINDTMGHPAGDQLLKIAGKVIVETVGDKGLVGRVGGDEFQIVIPKIDDEEALDRLAKQIIQNLGKSTLVEGRSVNISASIGVSIYDAESDDIDAVTLVRNADMALYAAKKTGGGVCRFYDAIMLKQASEERELEEDLRRALVEGELYLEYQPIINISDRTLSGFEALVRWNHPKKGPIETQKINKIADDIDIVGPIGDWTIRTACSQLKSWKTDLRIAVNVFPGHRVDGPLINTVLGALASSGIKPSQLELNITKSTFVEECEKSVSMFNLLRESGVRLVFNHFGTGYSSLGYLHQVRFDKLKIDQSFVVGSEADGRMNSAIISSIVTLARALKIETTADGVKTEEELELVKCLGCSQVQGNIFGKPLTLEDATALLHEHPTCPTESRFVRFREGRRNIQRRIKLYHRQYWYDAMVKNISRHGAMIEGIESVRDGSRLQIDFGNGQIVKATCIWSEKHQVGVRFEESINAEKLGPALLSKFGCPEAKAS